MPIFHVSVFITGAVENVNWWCDHSKHMQPAHQFNDVMTHTRYKSVNKFCTHRHWTIYRSWAIRKLLHYFSLASNEKYAFKIDWTNKWAAPFNRHKLETSSKLIIFYGGIFLFPYFSTCFYIDCKNERNKTRTTHKIRSRRRQPTSK